MSKKIAYLGAGSWGFCLASLLADKGYEVVLWTTSQERADSLNRGDDHVFLPGHSKPKTMRVTTDMAEAVSGCDLLCEGVTTAGIRPVFSQLKEIGVPDCPLVITSKGIEQGTGLLMGDVVADVLGEERRHQIGCLSGPSHAEEVINGLPTSVVCAGYSPEVTAAIQETFSTERFRVYPNPDLAGVEFGGAMKNVVAIACGLSDGLGFGDNTKSALMTRGLHEIRKLAVKRGCAQETMNGLAGMGDLCCTCLSVHSRNYRFGRLLATGITAAEAKEKIGMVVEGAYSCVSAVELGEKLGVALPISNAIYQILYKDLRPEDAVKALLARTIKEEHL